MDVARIAVILPCRDEAAAIASVVAGFRTALPSAAVYVIDNASRDATAMEAAAAGAQVIREEAPGKGNAVRRAFADIEADIYIMADGDGTYDAGCAPDMVRCLTAEGLDMVIGVRDRNGEGAYRAGHVSGNRAFSFLFRRLFRANFTDVLSGYRVLSRRFVKSFPLSSRGFEIEVEMCAHAALLRAPVAETSCVYGARPAGGTSKLRTFRDGGAILRRMLRFLRLHRPRLVYGLLSGLCGLIALFLGGPVVLEYYETGLVPRFPSLIVASAFMIAALIFFVVGVILDAQAQYFAETKRLAYLAIGAPPRPARRACP